ncbi:MAG: hypothetical protein KJ697_03305 [Nanoarchaeota archaeon]|nr:hypothetical protein [Nanoarchaeota archaeon]MBU4124065.1 hypothetical protein [Nanoarchaeota archaeon]
MVSATISEMCMHTESWGDPIEEARSSCSNLQSETMCKYPGVCKDQYRFGRPINLNGVAYLAYCKKAVGESKKKPIQKNTHNDFFVRKKPYIC